MAAEQEKVSLDHEQLWNHLRSLLDKLVRAVDQGSFLDDCLDSLVDLLGADRGLLLLFHPDGGTQAVNARGRGRALGPAERKEVSRTLVERVRRSGRCEIFRPLEETHPSESMIAIATALVAPLHDLAWRPPADVSGPGGKRRAQRPPGPVPLRGALYLDFRDRKRQIGEQHRELAMAAANMMAAVLDPYQKLQIAEEQARELRVRSGDTGPGLEELLAPASMAVIRREVYANLHSDSSILILGESGTGKTELARAIAQASGRKPVVRAMLGAADDLNTITSELFGHVHGAFTGSVAKRAGLVELADGGMLIFDEILNLPPSAQNLLLDFTQYGTYRPLGHAGREPCRASARLVAVTNGDMESAMRQGRFRTDLYFRLAGVTLVMPPLRERRQDIPELARGILMRADPSRGLGISDALERLLVAEDLPWTGNFRQLEAAVRRARSRALHEDPNATVLTPDHIEPHDIGRAAAPAPPARKGRAEVANEPARAAATGDLGARWQQLQRERERLAAMEKEVLSAALVKHVGVIADAAREVGIARTSLSSRMDTLGIPRGTGAS